MSETTLTEAMAAEAHALAWNQLEPAPFLAWLAPDAGYASQWVFDELHGADAITPCMLQGSGEIKAVALSRYEVATFGALTCVSRSCSRRSAAVWHPSDRTGNGPVVPHLTIGHTVENLPMPERLNALPSQRQSAVFTPILTVLPEVGGPFLWVTPDASWRGVGPAMCDGMGWDESMPLSEGLFLKFQDWELTLDAPEHVFCEFEDDWDWPAFHARGLQLARWLKEDVGDAYRVVYLKSGCDPNCRIDERREVLADGSLLTLPSFRAPQHIDALIASKIISGGQTGADRAALDFAIANNYPHGGWIAAGRLAEDGPLARKYQLQKLVSASYRGRTKQNVESSDGTLILNLGALDGGTRLTHLFAQRLNKPCLVVQLNAGIRSDGAARVLAWLRAKHLGTLNVAGPRESKRPGTYAAALALLNAVHALASG